MKKNFLFIALLLCYQTGFCQPVRIATYNTKLLPVPVLLYDLPIEQITFVPIVRAFNIARKFEDYDIVSFQEVMNITDNHALACAMERQGFHYATKRSGESWKNVFKGFFMSGGVRVFSKHFIEKTDYTIFPRCCYAERFTAKGAVYAKVIMPSGKPLHVFSLHAQSSREETKDEELEYLLGNKRQEQFQSLKLFIDKQWIPEGEPVLLLGDFNVDSGAVHESIKNSESTYGEFDTMLRELSAQPAGNYSETSLPYSHDTENNPVTLAVYPMGLRVNLDHILSISKTNGVVQHPLLSPDKTRVWISAIEKNGHQLSDHHAVSMQTELD